MTRIKVKEIVFDAWNIKHVRKHNVKPEEIFEAARNLIYHRVTYKNRYLAIGISEKRLITLILKRENTGRYYLVTARDASKKEREKIYAKQKK